MTMEFQCFSCGKHFYIYGIAEKAFNDRFDSNLRLRSKGYKLEIPSVWKSVQNRAKCCGKPNVSIVKWECKK